MPAASSRAGNRSIQDLLQTVLAGHRSPSGQNLVNWIVSIDLFQGQLQTPIESLRKCQLRDVVEELLGYGMRHAIILDIARVGSGTPGEIPELCRHIRKQFPTLLLTSGGGVSSPADLQLWADTGIDYLLVGTALHTGAIAPERSAKRV